MKSNWIDCTINDLGKIITGKTPLTKIADNFGDEYPFITPKDIQVTKHIFSCERYLSQLGKEIVKSCLLPPNSICVSCIGNLGYVAMTTSESVTNQQINSIIPNDHMFDPDFIYYLLKFLNPYFKNLEGQSTTLSILNKTIFSQIPVKVPSNIDEQRAISRVLNTLDDKIENNTKINNHLEQMAQAIFDEAFPSMALGNSTIGEFISPKRGRNLLSKDAVFGDVPVVAGGLNPSTYHNAANTVAPVITISASGANAGFVNLWNIPVWSSDSSYIDSKMTPYVYFWYVLIKKRQKEIYDAQTGSAQPHIYPQHIEALPIADLNFCDVKELNDKLTPLFLTIGNNIAENSRLADIRDTLLPRLMSGELLTSEAAK